MQVMPFWVKEIGTKEQDLFHLRINLRYGCTILRYYLDMEKGNLYRALGRYNGTSGQTGISESGARRLAQPLGFAAQRSPQLLLSRPTDHSRLDLLAS